MSRAPRRRSTTGASAPIERTVRGAFAGLYPAALSIAYKFPAQSGYTGAGHAIAVVIDSDIANSDLATFWKAAGVARTGAFNRVLVNATNPGVNRDVAETAIDTETTSSLAPAADIDLYLISSLDDAPIEDAYNLVVSNDNVDVASSSFGGCELADTPFASATDAIAEQGAALGISFTASTGDAGGDCEDETASGKLFYGPDIVSSPASGPHFLAIGGTRLTVNAATGARLSETAWGPRRRRRRRRGRRLQLLAQARLSGPREWRQGRADHDRQGAEHRSRTAASRAATSPISRSTPPTPSAPTSPSTIHWTAAGPAMAEPRSPTRSSPPCSPNRTRRPVPSPGSPTRPSTPRSPTTARRRPASMAAISSTSPAAPSAAAGPPPPATTRPRASAPSWAGRSEPPSTLPGASSVRVTRARPARIRLGGRRRHPLSREDRRCSRRRWEGPAMYLDRLRLDDRVALVTGGASGIGFATVQALAEAGAKVTIADLKQADIDAARRSSPRWAIEAEGVVMDVTNSAQVDRRRRRVGRARRPRSTSWSTTPGSPAARRRPRTSPTSTGSTCWTSTSTAPSGAPARLAATCWPPAPAPSSTSAR